MYTYTCAYLPCSRTSRSTFLHFFRYWGGAKHADCMGKIVAVDPKFKGKVKLDNGNEFQNPRSTTYAASLLHYFTQMRCSRFVLCPSGLGWDTYRLWEALSLGAIPIVEDSPGWIRVLDDLPVLIVKSFKDVTPQLLEKEYERITGHVQKYNFKRLTRQWWLDHFRSLLPPSTNTATADAPTPQNTSVCDPRFRTFSDGCMENSHRHPDCCAIDGEGWCADGYEGYQSDDMCGHNGGTDQSRATQFSYRMCCAKTSEATAKIPATSNKAPQQFALLGDGPCRDQHGKEPGHWNCQLSDVKSAKSLCESSCADASCRGYQVCDQFVCTGVCVIFTTHVPEAWQHNETGAIKNCSYVPGSDAAINQTRKEESMWKCFKRIDTAESKGGPSGSASRQKEEAKEKAKKVVVDKAEKGKVEMLAKAERGKLELLPSTNPLIDGVRQAIQTRHDFIGWKGRWGVRVTFSNGKESDEFGRFHKFGSFVTELARDKRFEYHLGIKIHEFQWDRGLCALMQSNRTSDYVALTSFDENWYKSAHPIGSLHAHAHLHPCAYHASACTCTQGTVLIVRAKPHGSLENGLPLW